MPRRDLVLTAYAPSVVRTTNSTKRALSQKPGAISKRRTDARKRAGVDHYGFDFPTAHLQAAMKIRSYLLSNGHLTVQGVRDCTSAADFSQQDVEAAIAGLVEWWWRRWLEKRNALLR